MKLRPPTTVILLLSLGVTLLGCPGDLANPPDFGTFGDKGGKKDGIKWDNYVPPKKDSNMVPPNDTKPWPQDQYVPPSDTQPWKFDKGYTGSPFGCQHDQDCFGLKCCATPWGVKLCATQCDW